MMGYLSTKENEKKPSNPSKLKKIHLRIQVKTAAPKKQTISN